MASLCLPSLCVVLVVVVFLVDHVEGQTALPVLNKIEVEDEKCTAENIDICKNVCAEEYYNSNSHSCPCFSIMMNCLTVTGCSFVERLRVVQTCTLDGFCKDSQSELFDGDCTYRLGDTTIEDMHTYRIR